MTGAAGQGNLYMVFLMQAREGAETNLSSLRPETPEAERVMRECVAGVKQSWGAPQAIKIDFAQGGQGRCGEGDGGE